MGSKGLALVRLRVALLSATRLVKAEQFKTLSPTLSLKEFAVRPLSANSGNSARYRKPDIGQVESTRSTLSLFAPILSVSKMQKFCPTICFY